MAKCTLLFGKFILLLEHINILLPSVVINTNLNIPNLTLLNKSNIPFFNSTGGNLFHPAEWTKICIFSIWCQMNYQKFPRCDKMNFGTAKVHHNSAEKILKLLFFQIYQDIKLRQSRRRQSMNQQVRALPQHVRILYF